MNNSAPMPPDRLTHGRRRQKLRTRNALIAAAETLVGEGKSPTVEDAAAASGISRTTAYRYFSNQAELLATVHPEIGRSSLLPAKPPASPEERLDLVVRELARMVVARESHYRTVLRLSLDPAAVRGGHFVRQGRAIGWIEDALAPLRPKVSSAEIRRLALATRSATGIEALVWLVDVAGLSRDDAVKTMCWTAKTLLRGALSAPSRRRARARVP